MTRRGQDPVERRALGGPVTEDGARPNLVVVRDRPTDDEASILAAVVEVQTAIATAAMAGDDVLSVILERTQRLTRSSGSVIEVLDGDEMVYAAATGSAEPSIGLRLSARTSLSGLCIRTHEVLRCDDAESDPRVDREASRRVGLRSMLVVPLFYREEPIGVLKVVSPEPAAYGDGDVRALELMATLIAASLGHGAVRSPLLEELRDRVDVLDGRPADEISTSRVREVVANEELAIVFQPIVDLATGSTVAVEALARFDRPPVSPDRWFAAAARAHLREQLEIAAAHAAIDRARVLDPGWALAVNVSPDVAISDTFQAVARRRHGRGLIIEVTEHDVVEDYERLMEGLSAIRGDGARLAIDDAGAGFASLRHILNLEPDIIKLDISLTREIDTSPRKRVLAASLLDFAAGTDATILAEGIETAGELETLADLGVSLGQGYHLARPAPPGELARRGAGAPP